METKTKKKKKSKNSLTDKLCIIALCAPAIIHLLIFWLGVQVETIRMMFTDYNTGKFSLINFQWSFNQLFGGAATSDIALGFRNTMIFFIVMLALVPVTIFFAYLIFRKCMGATFSRTALYLPGAVSAITMALLYAKLMESTGPVMHIVQNLTGSEEPIILQVSHGMIYILIFDVFMGVGGNLLLWLGGMNRIPDSLIEYGRLEGIGPFREFATIILPLMWPTVVTMVTLQVIGIFGSSGSVLTLTNGNFGTNTIAFWMYKMVQENLVGEFNHVAALGMVLTLATIPLVVVGRKFMNRYGEAVEY